MSSSWTRVPLFLSTIHNRSSSPELIMYLGVEVKATTVASWTLTLWRQVPVWRSQSLRTPSASPLMTLNGGDCNKQSIFPMIWNPTTCTCKFILHKLEDLYKDVIITQTRLLEDFNKDVIITLSACSTVILVVWPYRVNRQRLSSSLNTCNDTQIQYM